MFPTSEASKQVVKVTLGEDVRRLTVQFAQGTSAKQAFELVETTVRSRFGLPTSQEVVLKYLDDEEDLCTLVEATVEDLASLSPKVWRLQAKTSCAPIPVPVLTMTEASKGQTERSDTSAGPQSGEWGKGKGKCGKGKWISHVLPWFAMKMQSLNCAGVEHRRGCTDQCKGSWGWMCKGKGEGKGPSQQPSPWEQEQAQASMAYHRLPWFSAKVQSEFARNALNRAGVDQQESCTKLCQELLEHLSLVPESLPLAPRLQAFLDNSDREHFGDIIADLLQAWVASESMAGVQSSLALHQRSLRAIIKATLWNAWNKEHSDGWSRV